MVIGAEHHEERLHRTRRRSLDWNTPPQIERRFVFEKDTFSFPNELLWDYHFDDSHKWVSTRKDPAPDYWLHCFVVARSARQFFYNARFDPEKAKADDKTYRNLIHRVVSSGTSHPLPERKKVVIPGYRDLRTFSAEHEADLKAECGGAWQSYLQRGHWRMVFPFSHRHQTRMALRLLEEVQRGKPPVVHLVRFPTLAINHAVVIFDVREKNGFTVFSVYDPNDPSKPTTLTFDPARRVFSLPQNHYFPGGKVDVYEIYRNWIF